MGITGIIIIAAAALGAGALITFLILNSKVTLLRESNNQLEVKLEEREIRLEQEQREKGALETELATLRADYRNLQQRLTEQKGELEELQKTFRNEFRNLANDILEEKSKKFTEQNREKLDAILKPLGEKIYSDKPKWKTNRFRIYWEAWKRNNQAETK